jgi:hypothetical protein
VINLRVKPAARALIDQAPLLRDLILRTCHAAETIGIRGLLVHALSPAPKRFYESSGFRVSPANPMTLMVMLPEAVAAVGGA